MDVVVVGAGPVGMFLAGELQMRGVQTVVLERLDEPTGQSRAFRLQPRTLEIFDQRGLFDRVREGNLIWDKAHFAGIRPLLDLGALDSHHPYALLIPQARTESALTEWALGLGVELRRGHTLLDLAQDDDGVRLDVAGPSAQYQLTTRYVVGCDGGRSAVRRSADIGFEGTDPTVVARLADLPVPEPGTLPFEVPATLRTPRGLLMAVALEEGLLRMVTTEYDQPAPDRDTPLTMTEFQDSVCRITGETVELGRARWLSRFNDATRVATEYRSGRVLLAGDAAHIHFPMGAQGLNLGLLDAANLGWKLAAEVHGWAPANLLDTYTTERRPVADQALAETRAQTAVMNPSGALDPVRTFLSELLAVPEGNQRACEIISGLAVRYEAEAPDGEQHPLVGTRCPELRWAGGRLAERMRTGHAVLLDAAGRAELTDVATGWSDRVDVVSADPEGPRDWDALLVRPDGHVAWVAPHEGKPAEDADTLRAALTRWLGTPMA